MGVKALTGPEPLLWGVTESAGQKILSFEIVLLEEVYK